MEVTAPLTPRSLAETFRLPEIISFASGLVLDRQSYGGILLQSLKNFLQSSATSPTAVHIEQIGLLQTLPAAAFRSFAGQATLHIQAIWDAMQFRDGGLPLGHDGYLKRWALSALKAETGYILVDETQQINPVLLGFFSRFYA